MRVTLSYTLAVDEFPLEAVDVLGELGSAHALRIEWSPSVAMKPRLVLGESGITGSLLWDCECSMHEASARVCGRSLRDVTFRALAELTDDLTRRALAADGFASKTRLESRRESMAALAAALRTRRAALEEARSKLADEWPEEPARDRTKGGDDDE